MSSLSLRLSLLVGLLAMMSVGCGDSDAGKSAGKSGADEILIDGSSTVYPISVAMAEAFSEISGSKNVIVAAPSGTSGGFKKFIPGDIDINDASRPIKDSEIEKCKENGVDPLELTVAIDGISVVVNKDNIWCDSLTFAQLKALWEPDSKIKTWKDLNPDWPAENIKLFGPDGDSGTFEYFTKKVVETDKQCTDNYEPATDDNVLVKGVSGDKNALGYFGYGYYLKNRETLKGLSIANDGAAVAPTPTSIESYEYPLARPVFIYVNKARLSDKNMAQFLEYYLGDGQALISKAGCVQLKPDVLAKSVAALKNALAE